MERAINKNGKTIATLAIRGAMSKKNTERRCMRYMKPSLFASLITHLEHYRTTKAEFIPNFVAVIKSPVPASTPEAEALNNYIFTNYVTGDLYEFNDDMIMNNTLFSAMMAQVEHDDPKAIIFPYITVEDGIGHYLMAVAVPTGGSVGEYDIDILPTYALEPWMGVDKFILINHIEGLNKSIRIRAVNDVVRDLDIIYNEDKPDDDKYYINLQEDNDTCSNWGFRIANLLAKYGEELNDVYLMFLSGEEDEAYVDRLTSIYMKIYTSLIEAPANNPELNKNPLILQKYANGLPDNGESESNCGSECSDNSMNGNRNLLPYPLSRLVSSKLLSDSSNNSNYENHNGTKKNVVNLTGSNNLLGGGRRTRVTKRNKRYRKKTLRR